MTKNSAAAGGSGTLARTLEFSSLLAVAVGLVVSQGVMVIMLQGVGLAGLGFFAAIAIAYVLAITYVLSFAELCLTFKHAGTLSTYTEVALGHFPAIVAVFCGYIVVAMFALSAELVILDVLLRTLFPAAMPKFAVAYGTLVFLVIMNIRGVDLFAKIQSLVAYTMTAALLLIGIVAVSHIGQAPAPDVRASFDALPAGWGILTLIALAVWGFVGAEFVCPLVEEARAPERHIPRAMVAGVTLILVIYLFYCLGAYFYVPAGTLADSPSPHLAYVSAVFGEEGRIFLTVAAIAATCSTVNTTLAAVPRMIYGMARNGQTFSVLKKVHPRYKTPWVAIVLVAAITGIPILFFGDDPNSILMLLTGAAIAWLMAYVIAHLDVIVLRCRYPDLHRPFKTPLYPLPQVFGIAGMAFAIWKAAPTPEIAREVYGIAGIVIFGGSILAALWVKFVMKRGLFEVESVERLGFSDDSRHFSLKER